jgi:hypothetical protein
VTVSLALVPIGGLESLTDHAPKIKEAIAAGKPPAAIVTEMEPVALATLNYIAALFLPPPLGTALGFIEWVFAHRQAWTPEEEQAWWQRAQGSA